MYSPGRQGVTDELELDKAGLAADQRGRITVDGQYRTAVPHIFAVGDPRDHLTSRFEGVLPVGRRSGSGTGSPQDRGMAARQRRHRSSGDRSAC